VPEGQFKEDQPNLASLCFVSQQINYDYDPQTKLETLLTFLAKEHLPEYLTNKEYKPVWGAFRLLKLIMINITSISLFEILTSNEEILDIVYKVALKPQKLVSWFSTQS
jgi:hypothetical protein